MHMTGSRLRHAGPMRQASRYTAASTSRLSRSVADRRLGFNPFRFGHHVLIPPLVSLWASFMGTMRPEAFTHVAASWTSSISVDVPDSNPERRRTKRGIGSPWHSAAAIGLEWLARREFASDSERRKV